MVAILQGSFSVSTPLDKIRFDLYSEQLDLREKCPRHSPAQV